MCSVMSVRQWAKQLRPTTDCVFVNRSGQCRQGYFHTLPHDRCKRRETLGGHLQKNSGVTVTAEIFADAFI